MGVNHPAPDVTAAVGEAFAAARRFVGEFDPELVMLLGPDHYNGFFYDMMPPFCLGTGASSVGDYGTAAGPLPVDRDAALVIVRAVLANGIDLAYSERMQVDHGFAQPLEILFGSVDALPLVPVFINSVAEPLGPVSRARLLGEALGRAAADLGRRVLIVGSGGLSHDPPVPQLDGAPPEVVERLINGRHPTPDQRAAREQRVQATGRAFAAGTATIAPLNPAWDQRLMELLAAGDFAEIDSWSNEEFVELAGHSSHEVRTWIAAYAALAAAGPYRVETSFYRPIPEWIAGFGVTTARSLSTPTTL
jgi:2,3-dihydroxyphenylpropionate 1,2-dioxygenase